MRDKSAPEKRIRAAIKDYEGAVQSTVGSGDLDQATVGYQLLIASGLYTLGVSRSDCLKHAARAIDDFCDWVRRSNGRLGWYMDAQLHNEFVGAAYLADKTEQLFSVFEAVTWEVPPRAWERADLDLVCRAFGGRSPERDSVPRKLPKMPSPLLQLIPMLESMIDEDLARFEPAFVTFLAKSWGPSAEKAAKAALGSQWPLYTGKWSLLAAAACRKMGTIPDVPKKLEQYLPRELV